ncbi:MAG: chromosome partitioning protein ParB, partial [Actinomycetota bacterium]|nr:chromosome partitioning protein ParB [Actinomycetota bacterium]
LEARARATAEPAPPRGPRRARSRPSLHADQDAAIEQISDVLGRALGADVEVSAAGRGYRAQLTFESLEEALDLARRVGWRSVRR